MEFRKLDNFREGRFIGVERPFLYMMSEADISVRYYDRGEGEGAHLHEETTEIIVVVSGSIKFSGRADPLNDGDVVLIDPGEEHKFKALKKTSLVIFKAPCAPGDEVMIDETDLKPGEHQRKRAGKREHPRSHR